MDESAVLEVLSKRLAKAGSQMALSKELGIPQPRIAEAIAGRGVVTSLALALGFEKKVVFVPKK